MAITLPQLLIGIRYGKCTATTRVMVLSSLTNTAMSVICNGVSYPVALTALGNDRGVNDPAGSQIAGYSGSITITGLAEGVIYTYTVTQGSNSRSGKISPFYSAKSDFSFFVISCDSPNAAADENLYGMIRDYTDNGALPCVGYMHSDDVGYVDEATIDDTGFSGKKQLCMETLDSISTYFLNGNTVTAYDFAVVQMAYLGLLGNTANNDIKFGREQNRVWCRENLAFFPQWGNHEFGTPTMYNVPTTWTRATPMHATNPTTGGWDGNGRVVWNRLYGVIEPNSILATDVRSKPWGITIGNTVQIIAPDWLSNKNQANTILFGNAQIDDCIAAMNNTIPFKILLMAPQIRTFLTGDTVGSAPPMATNFAVEYSRLFTSNTVNSVMQSNTTNGKNGATFCIHGDLHHSYACCHRAAAFAGNNAELFYSINPGTVNKSAGHTFTPKIGDSGKTYSGGTVVGGKVGDTLEYAETTNNEPHVVRVDVYGSKPVPEMVISLHNASGEVWSRKWVAGMSNDALPTTYEQPQISLKKQVRRLNFR